MSPSDPRLRRAALLVSGACAVHQLRFALAPVDGGVGPGHAYMQAALPLLAVLVALTVTGFLARLIAPRAEGSSARSLRADWLACTAVLMTAFALQEGAESLLSAHGSIFAAGGWTAMPIAAIVGLAVALLARGARAAVAAAAPIVAHLRAVPPSLPACAFPPPAARRPAGPPLRHLAARPPPGSLVSQH